MTNQEILAKMAEQFMEPVITGKGDWYRMDGSNGTEFIPCTYAGHATDVTDPNTFDVHYSGVIDAVERVTGYGARLSAPGYMDCTEWSVFDTQEEAEQYLVDTYGDDIEEEIEEEDAEPSEPEEDDITTEDHRHFYQYGKLVLTVPEDADYKAALKAYMEKDQFWPNCWFISDHGNAHLMDLTEGKNND